METCDCINTSNLNWDKQGREWHAEQTSAGMLLIITAWTLLHIAPQTRRVGWGWVNTRRLHAQLGNYTSLTHDTGVPISIMGFYWANAGGGSSREHIRRVHYSQIETDLKKPVIIIIKEELTNQFSGHEENCLAWENSCRTSGGVL